MRIPKRYGQSREDKCPFCGSNAVTNNSQGVPVCIKHKSSSLDLKCICGSWLEVRTGKFGPYFNCMNCGNISFSKGLEMNPNFKKNNDLVIDNSDDLDKSRNSEKNELHGLSCNNRHVQRKIKRSEITKEITITTDDVEYF